MKKYGIIIILFLIIIIGGALYWLNKDNTMNVATEEKTTLSPTQVESIEAIGQWEFLAITMRNSLIQPDMVSLVTINWYVSIMVPCVSALT